LNSATVTLPQPQPLPQLQPDAAPRSQLKREGKSVAQNNEPQEGGEQGTCNPPNSNTAYVFTPCTLLRLARFFELRINAHQGSRMQEAAGWGGVRACRSMLQVTWNMERNSDPR
jgi:hypothetical protein